MKVEIGDRRAWTKDAGGLEAHCVEPIPLVMRKRLVLTDPDRYS